MEKKKIIIILATVLKLTISIILLVYFWKADDFLAIKYLDFWIIVLAIIYILLQLLTRKLSSVNHWWDWVYYIGLVCIMLSTIVISNENFTIFQGVSAIGTLGLSLPLFADFYQLFLKNKLK